jgi:hypothetical protein
VTWTFEEPRSESGSGIQLSLAEWLDGPDFVVMEFGEYKSSAVTPQGSQLAYATWAIDWKSVAGLAGGEALQLRLNGDEVLGANIWDPTTGLVDFTLFESQTARDRYSMGDSSVGPESAGVQLRMTISGPTDAWVVSLEDAASGTSLGSIQGSLPPRGLEDTALSDFTLDDVLEYVATNGRFGSHFLVSDDGLELVDQPPWVSLSGEEPTFFIEDGQMHANWFFQDTGTWQSPDGRAWSAVFAPGSFDGMSLDDVIHEGPGDVRVAVADVHGPGFDVEGQPPPSIIHLSVDGVEWAPPRQPPTFVPEVPGAVFVSATDEGFLLVAQVQEPRSGTDGPSELMIWTSVDGDIWEQADSVLPFGPPLDDAQQELRAISGHSVVILIGKDAGWIINTGN